MTDYERERAYNNIGMELSADFVDFYANQGCENEITVLKLAMKSLRELSAMKREIRDYIKELDAEIDRCHKLAEQNIQDEANTVAEMMIVRVQVLTEVKNDLQSRLKLEEMI